MMSRTQASFGKIGEETAVDLLKRLRYRILETNYRCFLGEIDIIAKDKRYLCFVEVKTRRSLGFGQPQEAVDEFKKRRLYRIAQYYLLQKKLQDVPARFDVVGVWLDAQGNVIKRQLWKEAF